MTTIVIAYLTVVTEGLIAIYACHQCSRGIESTWRDLGRRLVWRAPSLPVARAIRGAR